MPSSFFSLLHEVTAFRPLTATAISMRCYEHPLTGEIVLTEAEFWEMLKDKEQNNAE